MNTLKSLFNHYIFFKNVHFQLHRFYFVLEMISEYLTLIP